VLKHFVCFNIPVRAQACAKATVQPR
jgi:hypothetical protein